MANLPWDVRIADTLGKAIPNEVAKLSPWYRYIPYLNVIGAIVGGVDAGGTTASDLYQKNIESGMGKKEARWNAVAPAAQQAYAGTGYGGGANPGAYGSGGNIDRDWADYVGMGGNLANAFNVYQNAQNFGGQVGGVKDMGVGVGQIYNAASGNEDYNRGGMNDLLNIGALTNGMGIPMGSGGQQTNYQQPSTYQPSQQTMARAMDAYLKKMAELIIARNREKLNQSYVEYV